MSQTLAKLKFASPEWVQRFAEALEAERRALGDQTPLTVCEIYTGAPADLGAGPERRIVWTVRARGDRVEASSVECADDESDLKCIADYEAIRTLARWVVTPEDEEAYAAAGASLVEAGKLRIVRSPGPHAALRRAHNAAAMQTD